MLDILCRPNLDSQIWKEILSNNGIIRSCISCLGNYEISEHSSLPHVDTIRPEGIVQVESIGIWSKMPPKLSILLLRIKSKSLHTFIRLRALGINLQTTGHLCETEEESIQHLFFNCMYTRDLLLSVTEGAQLSNLENTKHHSPTNQRGHQNRRYHGGNRSTHWLMLGYLSHRCERNRRLKQHTKAP